MFLQSNKSHSASFELLIQFLHFIRLHQLVYQLTLVTIILFFSPSASLFQLLSTSTMIVLITPTFLLMQDILGKKDDEKAYQKRILFSDRVNKMFFGSTLTIMIIILALNSLLSLVCYMMLFASTIGYAVMKHVHRMYLSYWFRYLSSVFTFSLYLFMLVDSLTKEFLILLIVISVLDLVGNIAGDIRDSAKDTTAGIKTFVTEIGREQTLQIMCFILLCIFGLLTLESKSPILIILLVGNVFPFLLIEHLSIHLAHGIFHLLKLLNYLCIAFILSNIPIFVFILILFFIVCFWFISYYFYLYRPLSSN